MNVIVAFPDVGLGKAVSAESDSVATTEETTEEAVLQPAVRATFLLLFELLPLQLTALTLTDPPFQFEAVLTTTVVVP